MFTAFIEYLHKQKPKTNADRIRAMSDEELAVGCSNGRWVCSEQTTLSTL